MRRKLYGYGLVLALLGTSSPTLVFGQERPPVVVRAEECLRLNVDRVVAAEPDLHAAASFLTDYSCAEEVAGAARYRRNVAYLEAMRSMMTSMPALTKGGPAVNGMSTPISAKVDPETGEFLLPPHAEGAPRNPMEAMLPQMSLTNAQILPDVAPTELRKLAGELVLAARERSLRNRR